MKIGEAIREYRKEKGLTQKQLAELSGIATITIQEYEAGKYSPKYEKLQKIAAALRIDVNRLLDTQLESPVLKAIEQTGGSDSSLYQEYRDQLYTEQAGVNGIDMKLLQEFHKLNMAGKDKVISYARDLTKVEEYQGE